MDMVGKTIGHYQIRARLGAGGMGEVFRAEDQKLKRQVALKVLPREVAGSQSRLRRFQREAEALASLNHPSIVTIYSVEDAGGVPFITMELVEGRSLSKVVPRHGLDLKTIFEIAIPLADALSSAHQKGIVHRDLKPDNIMVNREGHTKVLDFGLATLRPSPQAPGQSSEMSTAPLTEASQILGTMPYMSPEQLDGRPVDARSDLFSMGVVLYEMAVGDRPFKGDSSASLISSIMRDRPEDIDLVREDLPHHLSRVIHHCLEKNPDERYQSAKDVRNELIHLRREIESGQSAPSRPSGLDRTKPRSRGVIRRRLTQGVVGALLAALGAFGVWQLMAPDETGTPGAVSEDGSIRRMIVVLPFDNLGTAEDEYFAYGMTDEIASLLASVQDIGVISRTSAMQYKDNPPHVSQIGADLGVDYVLEGSVRWEHDPSDWGRVRIIPQLIRVADDTQIWSERYVRVLDDVFAVQGEIAAEVIDALQVAIGKPELAAMKKRPTDNLEAYHAYLRGLEYRRSPEYSESDLQLAAQLFERAVELDPTFLEAWVDLSWVHSMIFFNSDQSRARRDNATAALERAQELGPDSPIVRAAGGYYYYRVWQNFERALEEFNAAITGLPGDVDVLAGIGFVQRRQGQWERSLGALEEAYKLDPRNGELAIGLAETYYAMRRYSAAAPFFDRAVIVAPDAPVFRTAKAYNDLELDGSVEAARVALDVSPTPDDPRIDVGKALLDLYERRFESALARLSPETLGALTPFNRAQALDSVALAQAQLGDDAAAGKSLEAGRILLEEELRLFPADPFPQGRLGRIYAQQGRRDEALEIGQRAVELFEEDHFTGPRFVEDLALIHAALGDTEKAIDLLEELLSVPYQNAIGPVQLRLDPRWDPLRDQSRFQQLTETFE